MILGCDVRVHVAFGYIAMALTRRSGSDYIYVWAPQLTRERHSIREFTHCVVEAQTRHRANKAKVDGQHRMLRKPRLSSLSCQEGRVQAYDQRYFLHVHTRKRVETDQRHGIWAHIGWLAGAMLGRPRGGHYSTNDRNLASCGTAASTVRQGQAMSRLFSQHTSVQL